MYKNIIVAFDNSEFSRAALIEAAHWVRRHGGTLTLVHAVYFDEEEFSIAPDQRERRLSIGARDCTKAREMVRVEFGIEAESITCEGEPPDVLIDIAKERNADLIAMGTHGRKGIRRLLMGSVTSRVVVHAPSDVLIVKRPCTECTGVYTSILVPYDGSECSRHALRTACQLSKSDSAAVNVLYVIPRYEEMVEFFKTSSIEKSLVKEAEKILYGAKEIASALEVPAATRIEEGYVGEKIVEVADRLRNDLILMGTYGWKGMDRAVIGSTAERVIANASCPVMVVK